MAYLHDCLVQIHHSDGYAQTSGVAITEDKLLDLVHLLQLLCVRFQPSFWAKHFSVVSKDIVQLETPGIYSNKSPWWYRSAIVDISLNRTHPLPQLSDWGITAKPFLDASLEVWHPASFSIRDWSGDTTDRGEVIYFGLELSVHSSIGDDHQENRAHRCCCRVGSSNSGKMSMSKEIPGPKLMYTYSEMEISVSASSAVKPCFLNAPSMSFFDSEPSA
jgi:hypothetical protein